MRSWLRVDGFGGMADTWIVFYARGMDYLMEAANSSETPMVSTKQPKIKYSQFDLVCIMDTVEGRSKCITVVVDINC